MEKELLLQMIATPSPSGAEFKQQKQIKAYYETFMNEVRTDIVGNVVGVLNPESKTKVLLAGHIDEIGLMVTHITESGLLKVTHVGGIRPALYLGEKVRILGEGGDVFGVVGVNSHLLRHHELQVSDLFVDIGATSKEEALKHVRVGNYLIINTTHVPLLNEQLGGRGLDNRVGAFIVTQIVKRVYELKTTIGVYGATSVGEETTMRGAHFVGRQLNPTIALAIDVTYATDYPGGECAKTGDVKLGGGPVLCESSIVNDAINTRLRELAKTLGFSIQSDIAVGRTGTDADQLLFSGTNVGVALVSIPLRYMHSPSEVVNLNDVEQIIELISQFILSLEDSPLELMPV